MLMVWCLMGQGLEFAHFSPRPSHQRGHLIRPLVRRNWPVGSVLGCYVLHATRRPSRFDEAWSLADRWLLFLASRPPMTTRPSFWYGDTRYVASVSILDCVNISLGIRRKHRRLKIVLRWHASKIRADWHRNPMSEVVQILFQKNKVFQWRIIINTSIHLLFLL